MSVETGGYNPYDKYNNPDDDQDNVKVDEVSGDEAILEATDLYEKVATKLSPDFQSTISDIISTADDYFDSSKAECEELLVEVTSILRKFADISDEAEIEDKEMELEEELGDLQKATSDIKKNNKPKTAIH